METKSSITKGHRSFATIWGELEGICKKIHYRLYERPDKKSAKYYESRLKGILEKIPKNELAILRAEGMALLHELKGDKLTAIKHRQKEIKLLERLHRSVDNSVENGNYDEKMASSIVKNWDRKALEKRRAILRSLIDEEKGQRNGVVRPASPSRKILDLKASRTSCKE